MARKMVDCRTMPSDINCTLTIAGEEAEVLDAAVLHAVDKHGHESTAELREQIRAGLVDAEPALT
jgi:predicted small metal-binding protein